MATRYIICLFLTFMCLCLAVEVVSGGSPTPQSSGGRGRRRLLVREHEPLDKAAKRQIVVTFSSMGTSSDAMEKGKNMVGNSAKVRAVWDSISSGDAIHTSNAVISSARDYVSGKV